MIRLTTSPLPSATHVCCPAACCLLTGGLMIAGAYAYLTDTAEATNTFTVGNVKVALKEPGYPGNDSP